MARLFLDWDDTLLPTSWLILGGYTMATKQVPIRELQALEVAIAALLCAAQDLCTVSIITNSKDNWVLSSCAKFLPTLLPALKKLSIVSARDVYETRHPARPATWKYQAFRAIVNSDPSRHMISIGDSLDERRALLALKKRYPSSYCKSIKFSSASTPEQLLRQITLVTQTLKYSCQHEGDLDIQFSLIAECDDEPPRFHEEL